MASPCYSSASTTGLDTDDVTYV